VAAEAAHCLSAGLLAAEAEGPEPAADAAVAARHEALLAVFQAYATFGQRRESAAGSSPPELDSFRCCKLFREAGLLGGGGGALTTQALDLIFAKAAKEAGSRR